MSPKSRELSADDKLKVWMFLVANTTNGKLRHRVVKDAVAKFTGVTCDAEMILKANEFLDKALV